MFHLLNKPQNYDWGRYGDESLTFKFMVNQDSEHLTKTDEPYAELWMGSHKKGESFVVVPGDSSDDEHLTIPISDFLQKKYNKNLPYLFKILSIKKCLSIQAHPDKELGKLLHENDPENYPDPNHKPEMAIAITPVKVFSNFCPKENLIQNLSRYPSLRSALETEIQAFADDEGSDSEKLKELFVKAESLGGQIVEKIMDDLSEIDQEERNIRDKLVEKLFTQFGADIGIVVTLMLNYLELEPGQCFVMHPKEPHAYLEGELFECKPFKLIV